MTPVTTADLRFLAGEHPSPCVSLFVPIAPGRREENDVNLRNQLARAEELLATATDPEAAYLALAPARRLRAALAHDSVRGGGLAHFACAGVERTFTLEASPRPLALVGSEFHIRPLLEEAEPGHFFLLALSHRTARLYRGTRHHLRPVAVQGMPAGMEDALRTHDSDEPLTLHSFRRGGTAEALFHGHGVGIDDHKDDLVRYFRAVDRAVHPMLRQETAPLVLAGVEYLFPLYAQANTYPHLQPAGVPGNHDHTAAAELHRAAWPLVAPPLAAAADRAVRQFRQFHGTGRTVTDPTELVEAAAAGGLEALLLTPSAEVWKVTHPGDELYNRVAVHVLRHGGAVHPVEPAALGGLPAAGIRWLPKDHHH